MKVFANRKIKVLFYKILISILAFLAISVFLIFCEIDNVQLYIILCAISMYIVILSICYAYFKEQNTILETAIIHVKAYASGDETARIECDDEGELYRLFHEVNTLATILNASVQRERRSKQFLKNTISDISHQLKTPLVALNIYNGLIQGDIENLSEVQEYAKLSEKELDRIELLVKNLLKIAKLDSGSVVFEKKVENVADMVREIELHFAYRAKQEQKELILAGDEDISLLCDHVWTVEALENIVKNAFDHTNSGDCINIRWKKLATVIQIIIEDNGSGIHSEDLHHIFKRFYRSKFSKDTQGIGLGLPLAKVVIEEQGGTIEVNSELGAGTSFIINFLIPTKL